MADINESVLEGGQDEVFHTETGKKQESTPAIPVEEKEEEVTLPNDNDASKGLVPGLPPIDLQELTKVLRNPNMPSQKIMKQVADKMMRSEESESDDGSVSSGGITGLKGLIDCILEVSLQQQDSDKSDDEEEDDVVALREIVCKFCSKIFGSAMTMKTHILVAHHQQDPSVLNIKNILVNEGDKGEITPALRKRSKGSSKSDCDSKEIKSRHVLKGDDKTNVHLQGEENIPVSRRRVSRSQTSISSAETDAQNDIQVQHASKDKSSFSKKISEESTPIVSSTPKAEADLLAATPSQIHRQASQDICEGDKNSLEATDISGGSARLSKDEAEVSISAGESTKRRSSRQSAPAASTPVNLCTRKRAADKSGLADQESKARKMQTKTNESQAKATGTSNARASKVVQARTRSSEKERPSKR